MRHLFGIILVGALAGIVSMSGRPDYLMGAPPAGEIPPPPPTLSLPGPPPAIIGDPLPGRAEPFFPPGRRALSKCQVNLPPPVIGTITATTTGQCDAGSVAVMANWITGHPIGAVEPRGGNAWSVELLDPAKPFLVIQREAKFVEPALLRPGAGAPR